MADRPWVKPWQVREYTTRDSVKERTAQRLEIDIARAESYVIAYCKHDFSSDKYASGIPPGVKTAVILIAEQYATTAAASADGFGLYSSETYDDYSYTTQSTQSSLDNMILGPLLDPYIETPMRAGIRMDAHKW